MNYLKLVRMISNSKWQALGDRLIDRILASKNDDRMPSALANTILRIWQQDRLLCEEGVVALLEASILLEPEKTISSLNELQLSDVAEQAKQQLTS